MKNGIKKTLLVASLALLTVAVGVSTASITYAGYQRTKIIEDPTKTAGSKLTITGQGTRLISYYLDLGIWGTIDNNGYSFWALLFKFNNSTPTVLKYVKGTLSGVNYQFTVDTAKYDRIKFFRTASSNDATLASSTNYQHSYYTSTSPGMATDASGELSFVSGMVTYEITGWHGGFIDAEGHWR